MLHVWLARGIARGSDSAPTCLLRLNLGLSCKFPFPPHMQKNSSSAHQAEQSVVYCSGYQVAVCIHFKDVFPGYKEKNILKQNLIAHICSLPSPGAVVRAGTAGGSASSSQEWGRSRLAPPSCAQPGASRFSLLDPPLPPPLASGAVRAPEPKKTK